MRLSSIAAHQIRICHGRNTDEPVHPLSLVYLCGTYISHAVVHIPRFSMDTSNDAYHSS
jgi:hypothetical protein